MGTRVQEAEERKLFLHAGTYIHTWEVEALVVFRQTFAIRRESFGRWVATSAAMLW